MVGTPYQDSIACACYAAVSMPLVFMQEDFLVTAHVRSMREGTVFTGVCQHLGGYLPFGFWVGGYLPSQVWLGWGGTYHGWSGGRTYLGWGGGVPTLAGVGGTYLSRSGWVVPT